MTEADPILTGKIALAHLKQFPDYYVRLERMEAEAEREREVAAGAAASRNPGPRGPPAIAARSRTASDYGAAESGGAP